MSKLSDEDVARYWDGNAEVWADHVRRGWDAYREHFNNPAMLRFIGDLAGKTVLDAGCGEGRNTRLLAKAGARMTGIDVSPRMIEFAAEEEERRPLGIRYEAASFSDLSVFADESFDAVVSFMALMDGPDFEGAANEAFRLLRPGGELCFSMTHPCFMTPGFGWVPDDEGREGELKLTVSHYFSKEPRVEEWRFSKGPIPADSPPFEVPYFPRTLSEYLNALVEAGLAIRRIEEPRPTEKACREHPWLRCWRNHAAIFIYVRAAKPAGAAPARGHLD